MQTAAGLRKPRVCHRMGTPCLYQPVRLRSEPNLAAIGNNLSIAAGVMSATRDGIRSALKTGAIPTSPVNATAVHGRLAHRRQHEDWAGRDFDV